MTDPYYMTVGCMEGRHTACMGGYRSMGSDRCTCPCHSAQEAPAIAKDDAPCCNAKRDGLGRLPIGFCGPDCVRRP